MPKYHNAIVALTAYEGRVTIGAFVAYEGQDTFGAFSAYEGLDEIQLGLQCI